MLQSRFPRMVTIVIAGIVMSISGLIMQQLSRNKFVSPTTAGTMDSARLGLLLAIIIFPSAALIEKMAFAFIFALAGTFLFMKILDQVKYKDTIFIPLVGLMFGNIVGSISTFFAYKYDLIQSLNTWMNGDFSMIMSGRYELIYLSIPLVILAYFFANKFTVAGMGEVAINLGLNYKHSQFWIDHRGIILHCRFVNGGNDSFHRIDRTEYCILYLGDNLKRVFLIQHC